MVRRQQPSAARCLNFEPLESRQLLSLTHWYTFNDGTATDLAGTNDLTAVNGVQFSGGQAYFTNAGVTSGDTANVDYLQLPAAALPGTSSITIETWFTTAAAANWTRLFDFGNQAGGNGDSYLFYTPQSSFGDSRLVLTPGGIAGERVASTGTADDGAQHMVAAVVDSGANLLRLYVDGSQQATASLSGANFNSLTKTFAWFGRSLYNNDEGFSGQIDEIRIYDEALSASTISQHHQEGPVPNEPIDPPADLPPRQVEALDRGLIALRRSSSQVYLGWRMLGTDPADVSFNLYRSANGGPAVKLNASPLTTSTNFVDTTANTGVANAYFVRPIIQGIELAPSETFVLAANSTVQQHLTIPLNIPAGGTTPTGENYTYSANDATVGDVDGDGQYEIILKWDPSNSKDNSQSGYTGNVYVDAYKLDGTQLWRIDLGRNIRAGAHYTQMTVYDFDGDGRAEVILKTAPGTVDGQGNNVLMGRDSAAADYRNSSGYVLSGPEYLTVFNGLTGAEEVSIPFAPARGSVSSWGDTYGNRVDRFLTAVAYLDGVRPSLVFARGYYGPQSGLSARNEVVAYDYRDGQLTERWRFEAASNGAYPDYIAQGSNALSIGDVDFDGFDEIIHGAAALDHDGSPLYSTGLGHGDALHMSDMLPSRPGLEVFMVHESPSAYESQGRDAGGEFRDAATGELLFQIPSNNDVGRGVALDIDPNSPGYEMWATTNEGTRYIYSATGEPLYETPGNMMYNFGIWWDADLTRELLDGTTISEWNNPGRSNLVSFGNSGINSTAGLSSNNGTKSTPALSGDILGDWREEVIWRRSDNTALEIWSTTITASNRLVTLMHDTQYRSAIAWQNVAYNQPPHPSFFLGAGMADPPTPNIYTANANPTNETDFDLDLDVDGEDLVIWGKMYGGNQSAGYLPGDADSDDDVDGADFLHWQRNVGYSLAASVVSTEIAAEPMAAVVSESFEPNQLDQVFATSGWIESLSLASSTAGSDAETVENSVANLLALESSANNDEPESLAAVVSVFDETTDFNQTEAEEISEPLALELETLEDVSKPFLNLLSRRR